MTSPFIHLHAFMCRWSMVTSPSQGKCWVMLRCYNPCLIRKEFPGLTYIISYLLRPTNQRSCLHVTYMLTSWIIYADFVWKENKIGGMELLLGKWNLSKLFYSQIIFPDSYLLGQQCGLPRKQSPRHQYMLSFHWLLVSGLLFSTR